MPPLLARARDTLEAHLVTATLSTVAHALAVSDRTLQRGLMALGTSFTGELQAARIRVAERLLVTTDDSVLQIGIAVGVGSPAHFSALFRKLRGETPTAFRRRHRDAG